MLKAKISIQRLEYRMQKTHTLKKYTYIDKCCIQYVQIENIGAVIVTYFGNSTVCTIACTICNIGAPCEATGRVRVSSFTESELCI